MNRETLEKMFNDKFTSIAEGMPIFGKVNENGIRKLYELDDVKQFIFETIIPEVIQSILIEIDESEGTNDYRNGYNNRAISIKQNLRTLYNIKI